MMKFNEIKTRDDLANFLGLHKKNYLTYILYILKPEKSYITFSIPKKSGGKRIIHAPNDKLKNIQKMLAKKIWEHELENRKNKNLITSLSHAFEPKYKLSTSEGKITIRKNIVSNAKIHRNRKFIINLDLKDFFDSFHFGRVRGYFANNENYRLPLDIATIIAQLTCYEGKLPQGAPTSPIITNLICQILDIRLMKLAHKFHLNYTRYADDLTFSTNEKNFLESYDFFLNKVKKEIERAGFIVNEKKTRIQYKNSRQEVTGLVVNKKVNVPSTYYKLTKSLAHHLYQGHDIILDGQNITKRAINVISGRFAFIDQILIENNKFDSEKHGYTQLSSREKEYKKFIFYKTFFVNPKPLIVTEGKTDIVHLKSAIKKLYDTNPIKYDKLVTKLGNKYQFKIAFLNKTKKLKYFLNISQYGGDALNVISAYYKEKKYDSKRPTPNYNLYFSKLSGKIAQNPLILLFDNEPNSNKSPLYKYLGGQDAYQKFKNEGFIDHKSANLYSLTFPLPQNYSGDKDGEIEDLFSKDLLNIEIDGRKFDRGGEQGFSKAIFADYVSQNYQQIDFNNFVPLLDNIIKVIENYEKNKHE